MYSKNEILSAILLRFDSQRDCAKALGISESTFSRLLNNPSEKFIKRLTSLGVTFDILPIGTDSPVMEALKKAAQGDLQRSGRVHREIEKAASNLSIEDRLLKLEKEVTEVKARNFDLIEENQRLKAENQNMRDFIEVLLPELGKVNLTTSQLEAMRKLFGMDLSG